MTSEYMFFEMAILVFRITHITQIKSLFIFQTESEKKT